MARLVGNRTRTRAVRLAAGATTFSVAAVVMLAMASSGTAMASTVQNYSASVSATGLDLSLFGNTLSGGFASACVNSGSATSNPNSHCDTLPGPEAYGTAQGILLTSSGLTGSATAEANSAGSSVDDPASSTPPTVDWGSTTNPTITAPASGLNCSQLSSGGPQGSSGVTLDLGAACANAQAAVDSNGVPTADAYGEVAHLNVDLNGILGQVLGASSSSSSNDCNQSSSSVSIGALLNGVCQVVNSVAGSAGSSLGSTGTSLVQAIDQALQNLGSVTSNDLGDTVTVAVGPAVSQISQAADGTVTVAGLGSTLDIGLLDGVGCVPGTPLLTCADNTAASLVSGTPSPTAAPLVDIDVAPAGCVETRDPSTGTWTGKAFDAVVTVNVNLPGDPVSIPVLANEGASQTILSGTPLQTTIELANQVLGSSGCTGNSVTVSALESSTFPGGSSTPGSGGAILASLGTVTDNVAGSSPATASTQSPPAPAPTVPVVSAESPTAVHTGEWWAGSLPLLGVLAAAGGALIGWPRLRRIPAVARIVSRGR